MDAISHLGSLTNTTINIVYSFLYSELNSGVLSCFY